MGMCTYSDERARELFEDDIVSPEQVTELRRDWSDDSTDILGDLANAARRVLAYGVYPSTVVVGPDVWLDVLGHAHLRERSRAFSKPMTPQDVADMVGFRMLLVATPFDSQASARMAGRIVVAAEHGKVKHLLCYPGRSPLGAA